MEAATIALAAARVEAAALARAAKVKTAEEAAVIQRGSKGQKTSAQWHSLGI